jgi:hypothetical protein
MDPRLRRRGPEPIPDDVEGDRRIPRNHLAQLRQFGEDYDFFQGFLGVFGEVFVISRYVSVEVGAEGDGKAL